MTINEIHTKKEKDTQIFDYTLPVLHKGKKTYIDFKCYDPVSETMKRKKYFLDHIKDIKTRNLRAKDMMGELSIKLRSGWNPNIEKRGAKQMHTFKEVVDRYLTYISKLYQDNIIKEETYSGYISYLRMIVKFNEKVRVKPIVYIFQFDREFIVDMLNWIFLDMNRKPQTRDNYLAFVRIFSSYLVQNSYQKTSPAEGITVLGKKFRKKERTIIEEVDIKRLSDFLTENNPHYLLACYFLHYCFIRPKEMAKLQIKHIHLKEKVIHIPAEFSKNKKSGNVSMPEKMIHLMLDLKILSFHSTFYIFSNKFIPGKDWRDEKQFRDYWNHHVRKRLRFPATYKFYSLKDTGITSMIRANYDPITVRDQARHSSILMTDIYTPHDIQEANQLIVKHQGIL